MDEILEEEEKKPLYIASTEELAERRHHLETLLAKYQHNKENISKGELTSKYRKPWNRLRDSICEAVQAYSQPILFNVCQRYIVINILADERDKVVLTIMDEIGGMLKQAIWEQASIAEIDKVLKSGEELAVMKLEAFIAPYTVSYNGFAYNVALGAIKKDGDGCWQIPTYR